MTSERFNTNGLEGSLCLSEASVRSWNEITEPVMDDEWCAVHGDSITACAIDKVTFKSFKISQDISSLSLLEPIPRLILSVNAPACRSKARFYLIETCSERLGLDAVRIEIIKSSVVFLESYPGEWP